MYSVHTYLYFYNVIALYYDALNIIIEEAKRVHA